MGSERRWLSAQPESTKREAGDAFSLPDDAVEDGLGLDEGLVSSRSLRDDSGKNGPCSITDLMHGQVEAPLG